MYKNLRLLAVVPARGGSKGIPHKNIQAVRGIPLVGRTASLLSALDWVDRAVVSTDSDAIAEAAEKYGLDAPFRRPEHLSGDRIGDYEVLLHALTWAEESVSKQFDAVIMLQPTSPMRQSSHIVQALDLFVDGGYDAVWSVSESDTKNHPLKQLTVADQVLDYYDREGAKIISRQQLTPLYQRNGIVYVIGRKCLLEHQNIKGERTGALVIPERSVSIDTPEDLEYVEFLMDRHGDPLNNQDT